MSDRVRLIAVIVACTLLVAGAGSPVSAGTLDGTDAGTDADGTSELDDKAGETDEDGTGEDGVDGDVTDEDTTGGNETDGNDADGNETAGDGTDGNDSISAVDVADPIADLDTDELGTGDLASADVRSGSDSSNGSDVAGLAADGTADAGTALDGSLAATRETGSTVEPGTGSTAEFDTNASTTVGVGNATLETSAGVNATGSPTATTPDGSATATGTALDAELDGALTATASSNGTILDVAATLDAGIDGRLAASAAASVGQAANLSTGPAGDGRDAADQRQSVDDAADDTEADGDGASRTTADDRREHPSGSETDPQPSGPFVPGQTVAGGVALVGGALAVRTGVSALGGVQAVTAAPPVADGTSGARTTLEWARAKLPRILPFGYSRYDDSDPLEHEVRASLYETIERAPGVHLSALDRRTDVSLSTVRHHLRILDAESLVETEHINGRRRYFPAGTSNTALLAALDDDARANVLHAVADHEPASVSELADALDRDPSTISHHLSALADEDLVERERDGRSVRTRLAPPVRVALDAGDAGTGGAEPTAAD